jgi:hypothetical protein
LGKEEVGEEDMCKRGGGLPIWKDRVRVERRRRQKMVFICLEM